MFFPYFAFILVLILFKSRFSGSLAIKMFGPGTSCQTPIRLFLIENNLFRFYILPVSLTIPPFQSAFGNISFLTGDATFVHLFIQPLFYLFYLPAYLPTLGNQLFNDAKITNTYIKHKQITPENIVNKQHNET